MVSHTVTQHSHQGLEGPTQQDLTQAMVDAALPCIKAFIAAHSEETFFGFAVELLAEEGYFHLCASSNESFQSTYDYYLGQGDSPEDILEEVKWNNQEWKYFDFNDDCEVWSRHWQAMEQRIEAYKGDLSDQPEASSNAAFMTFRATFEAAGKAAFDAILASQVLDGLKKTADFRAFVFEHHDVF